MIKDKQITIQVFDTDILKKDMQVVCKCKGSLDITYDEYGMAQDVFELECIITNISEECIAVKTKKLFYRDNPWSDDNYRERYYNIEIDSVIDGFWEIKIV
jgi:hypothetical protein